jgi:trigger factor
MAITSYSEISASRRIFEIEVAPEEIEEVRRGITRHYARRAALPGFRKGKVPEAVVARKFAHEIREELLEQVIPQALTEALREKGVQPLGRPTIENLKFEEGEPLAFKANVDVRPPIDPGEYSGIEVHDVAVEATPEEIDQTVSRIRESHAEFLPIEGRAAADGDFAIADIAYRLVESQGPLLYTGAGEPIAEEKAGDWHKDEKITLEVGNPDTMPEINDALRGASPGETRRFRKTFAPDFQNDRFAGKTLDYDVTLAALKEKQLPELDDNFAAHVGEAATLEELRGKIAEGLRHDKEAARRRKFRREILDRLLSQSSVPAPEALVEAETESALEEYASYMAANGADPKAADWDRLASDARPGAERRVREYLLLDEIARRENLEVSETEVEAEVRRSAQRRGLDPVAAHGRLVKEGRLGSVRQEIRLNKAESWLVDHARVVA